MIEKTSSLTFKTETKHSQLYEIYNNFQHICYFEITMTKIHSEYKAQI